MSQWEARISQSMLSRLRHDSKCIKIGGGCLDLPHLESGIFWYHLWDNFFWFLCKYTVVRHVDIKNRKCQLKEAWNTSTYNTAGGKSASIRHRHYNEGRVRTIQAPPLLDNFESVDCTLLFCSGGTWESRCTRASYTATYNDDDGTKAPPPFRPIEIWIKRLMTECRQRSTSFCADMSQNPRGSHQDKTNISTPELIQHMLVVEDEVLRPNPDQKNKLWRRVLVGVLRLGSYSCHYLGPFTFGWRRLTSEHFSRNKPQHHAIKVNGWGR